MVRRIRGGALWVSMCVMACAFALSVPAFAQSTGMIKGVVTDDKGQPVEGAKVTIEMNGGTGRKYEAKTNKKGEYIQIGVGSGPYKVSAESGKMGSAPANVQVRANATAEANLQLTGASASAAKEAQAKNAAVTKLFDDAVALSNQQQHDAAIAKFQEAIAALPNCSQCYTNIGLSYSQKAVTDKGDAQKADWASAETAFKKAIEIKADDATAYVSLAAMYINTGRQSDARPLLEKAITLDANNAESHYFYGMVLVADPTGAAQAKAEFQKYLASSPTDAVKAATAKGIVDSLP